MNGSWTWQAEGTDYEETERVELLQVALSVNVSCFVRPGCSQKGLKEPPEGYRDILYTNILYT